MDARRAVVYLRGVDEADERDGLFWEQGLAVLLLALAPITGLWVLFTEGLFAVPFERAYAPMAMCLVASGLAFRARRRAPADTFGRRLFVICVSLTLLFWGLAAAATGGSIPGKR